MQTNNCLSCDPVATKTFHVYVQIAATCALFKSEDKKHRNFSLMHCWRILKDQPKWIERRKQIGGPKATSNKKQKTKENSSPSSHIPVLTTGSSGVDAAPAQDSSKRPDGTKTEKKKLRQRSTIEALDYLVAKMKEDDADQESINLGGNSTGARSNLPEAKCGFPYS